MLRSVVARSPRYTAAATRLLSSKAKGPAPPAAAVKGKAAATPPPPPPPPTSAASHRPLIDFYGLPARYANAAYISASKVGVLEQVEKELIQLQQSSKTSAKFHEFLNNPLISRSEKTKVVGTMSDKLSTVTVNLLSTLAGNARLSLLPKVVEIYAQMMKAKRGQVEAVIITADPLTKTQEEAVAAAMKAQFLASRGSVTNVVITTQVDPTILGGLQVKMGDQFLDLSVKSRIDELAQTPV